MLKKPTKFAKYQKYKKFLIVVAAAVLASIVCISLIISRHTTPKSKCPVIGMPTDYCYVAPGRDDQSQSTERECIDAARAENPNATKQDYAYCFSIQRQ